MNNVAIVGRLVRDVEARYTQGENPMAIARFSVAVDRRFKKDGEQTADFISVVAFGKTGEFVDKYFSKGMRIGLTGRIQTGSYDKDGVKIYTTDVVAEQVEFVESKSSSEGQTTSQPKTDTFVPAGGINDSDELPFQ